MVTPEKGLGSKGIESEEEDTDVEEEQKEEQESFTEEYEEPDATRAFQPVVEVNERNPETFDQESLEELKETVEKEKEMINKQVMAAEGIVEVRRKIEKAKEEGESIEEFREEYNEAKEDYNEAQQQAEELEDKILVGDPKDLSKYTIRSFREKAGYIKGKLDGQVESAEAVVEKE